MENIACDNKEREAVVFFKSLGRDEEFMTINDRKEYERVQYEIEKEEAINEAVTEAVAEATKEALEQGKIEMIKAMYEKKISIKVIAECSKLSIEEVKKS